MTENDSKYRVEWIRVRYISLYSKFSLRLALPISHYAASTIILSDRVILRRAARA